MSRADNSILRLWGLAVNTAKYKRHVTITFEPSRFASIRCRWR